MLEAAIDGRIVYITEDGRYLLGGPMFDINADQNLTDLRLEQINMLPFGSLPLEWAFDRTRGTGARSIAVFMSPDSFSGTENFMVMQ
ncbi:disulfide isomerase DsbC N-terminal domain-containing protein [Hydrogenophaga sp.]|uniref:disulfide isomerase DsbC N-terminal domain-containing protein n=1 Tax=Hydrogenophaga sp. TaxID=1904254 RepID=UPI0025C19F10|nr:disulfide isomerase DsbC N-terminal domain-containing protein [Hydrogenophaga sp.]